MQIYEVSVLFEKPGGPRKELGPRMADGCVVGPWKAHAVSEAM